MTTTDNVEIISFASPKEWEKWLAKHHAESKGIWLRMFKKNSGKTSVTYAEALDVALCYGWIDSQMKGYDDVSYIQKFTPRGPKSVWSKLNTQHVERLIREGKMQPAGLAQVEAAKHDGRWQDAYDPPSAAELPKDFIRELDKDKEAKAFFKTLNKSNTYAIAWRLQTAKKPETRVKRMQAILEQLHKGEKFHE